MRCCSSRVRIRCVSAAIAESKCTGHRDRLRHQLLRARGRRRGAARRATACQKNVAFCLRSFVSFAPRRYVCRACRELFRCRIDCGRSRTCRSSCFCGRPRSASERSATARSKCRWFCIASPSSRELRRVQPRDELRLDRARGWRGRRRRPSCRLAACCSARASAPFASPARISRLDDVRVEIAARATVRAAVELRGEVDQRLRDRPRARCSRLVVDRLIAIERDSDAAKISACRSRLAAASIAARRIDLRLVEEREVAERIAVREKRRELRARPAPGRSSRSARARADSASEYFAYRSPRCFSI